MSIAATLFDSLPDFVKTPPVECVVFAWGANEDRQLGAVSECPSFALSMSGWPWIPGCDAEDYVSTPRVIESLLGCRLRGRRLGCNPLVAGSRNTMAVSQVRQPSTAIGWRRVTVVSGRMVWYGRGGGTIEAHWAGAISLSERTVKRRYGSKMFRLFRWQSAAGIAWRSIRYIRFVSLDPVECGDGWMQHGKVYAWGGNEYMQCALEISAARDILHPTPIVPHLCVHQVACGGENRSSLS